MAKKIALYGMFTALAIILSAVERLIPMPIPAPGVKLGLANVVVIIFLYAFGEKPALFVSVLRVAIIGFLFGSGWSVLYSLAGGLLSFAAMAAGKRAGVFSVTGVSVLGGVFHNAGQIAVAALATQSVKLFYYLPVLILAGEVTGVLIGFIAAYTIRHAGLAAPGSGV